MLEFKVNIVQLFNIGAIFNGFIFCFLLLSKKENQEANRFLSLLIFSLSFTLLNFFFLEFKLYDSYPLLHLLPFTLTYWIGPSFYFYIRSLIDSDFKFKSNYWWHFGFIALNYIHSVYHLIYGRSFPHPLFHNFTEAVITYALIPILIYTVLSFRLVKKYQKSILNQVSTTENFNLKWVNQLIWFFAIVFFFNTLFKLIDYKELIDFSVESYQGSLFPYRDLLSLVMALSIYWLAISGYKQKQTVNTSEPFIKTTDEKDYSLVVEKLRKSMMEDKLFLAPTLDLKMLSEATKLSRKEISIALNQHLNKNFYYFINEYRVQEAIRRLSDPQYSNLKILSIAFDCGFNSKPTFNRVFKELTGKSPKEYQTNQ